MMSFDRPVSSSNMKPICFLDEFETSVLVYRSYSVHYRCLSMLGSASHCRDRDPHSPGEPDRLETGQVDSEKNCCNHDQVDISRPVQLTKAEKKAIKFAEKERQKAERQHQHQEQHGRQRQEAQEKRAEKKDDTTEKTLESFGWFRHASWGSNAGLTARPAPRDDVQMATWVTDGATAVVTLLQRKETAFELVQAGAHRWGLHWQPSPLVPISNVKKKLSEEDWLNFRMAADKAMWWLYNGERIVVHCAGGFHRTGCLLYVLLRRSGLSSKEAEAALKEMREKTWYEMTAPYPKRPEGLIQKAEEIYQRLESGEVLGAKILRNIVNAH